MSGVVGSLLRKSVVIPRWPATPSVLVSEVMKDGLMIRYEMEDGALDFDKTDSAALLFVPRWFETVI